VIPGFQLCNGSEILHRLFAIYLWKLKLPRNRLQKMLGGMKELDFWKTPWFLCNWAKLYSRIPDPKLAEIAIVGKGCTKKKAFACKKRLSPKIPWSLSPKKWQKNCPDTFQGKKPQISSGNALNLWSVSIILAKTVKVRIEEAISTTFPYLALIPWKPFWRFPRFIPLKEAEIIFADIILPVPISADVHL